MNRLYEDIARARGKDLMRAAAVARLAPAPPRGRARSLALRLIRVVLPF